MKFTSPEFFVPFRTQFVKRPVFPFATLETTKKKTKQNKKTGAAMLPAIVSGIATGDAPVSCWQFFSLSLVTVPEVFMKVKSAKFSSCFFFLK